MQHYIKALLPIQMASAYQFIEEVLLFLKTTHNCFAKSLPPHWSELLQRFLIVVTTQCPDTGLGKGG